MELYRTVISIDIKTGKTLSSYTSPEPVKTMPDNEYAEVMSNFITGKSLEEVRKDLVASVKC